MTTLEHVYQHLRIKFSYAKSYLEFKTYFFYFYNTKNFDRSCIDGVIFSDAIRVYEDLKSKPELVAHLNNFGA